jgi:hypothetical protein
MSEDIIHIENRDEQIDKLEATMIANFDEVDCPLTHIFTPGLYTRQIFMPAGTLIVSKIHKTEHPFIVSQGAVSVWIDDGEEIFIEAPYIGITKPGTRRVLYIHEDCTWTTIHANPDNENEIEVEERIIDKHSNPLLSEAIKNKIQCHLSAPQLD